MVYLPLYRLIIREAAAEFIAVAIMIIFGNGVDCQAVLSMNTGVAPFPRGVRSSTASVGRGDSPRMIRTGYHSPLAGLLASPSLCTSLVVFLADILTPL